MKIISALIPATAGVAFLASPAFAQDTPPPSWSGEGAFNAGITSGNTETTDIGIAVKLKHVDGQWTQSGELAADYGEKGSVESKNRIFLAGQLDRTLNEQWSSYGRLTWERDQFSGFDNRYFAGLGVSFAAIDTDETKWKLEGGPGYKIDEVRQTPTTPAATEESLGARAGSKFSNKLNEAVTFSNDTEAVYSSTSTRLANQTALTATVWGNLSARFSVEVRHDTNPLPGFQATDTASKVSFVYKIS